MPERFPRDSEVVAIAGWTGIVSLIMFALFALIPLDTKNARGQQQELTGLEIWRRTLTHLPSDLPFFLNTWTLTILSVAALITSASAIVAIVRMPR